MNKTSQMRFLLLQNFLNPPPFRCIDYCLHHQDLERQRPKRTQRFVGLNNYRNISLYFSWNKCHRTQMRLASALKPKKKKLNEKPNLKSLRLIVSQEDKQESFIIIQLNKAMMVCLFIGINEICLFLDIDSSLCRTTCISSAVLIRIPGYKN